jgi:hypothetical protein
MECHSQKQQNGQSGDKYFNRGQNMINSALNRISEGSYLSRYHEKERRGGRGCVRKADEKNYLMISSMFTPINNIRKILHISFFFPLALQQNSGPVRLYETFRFTSFTRSRKVGRTPWMDAQLVARPLPVNKHRKTHTQHKH